MENSIFLQYSFHRLDFRLLKRIPTKTSLQVQHGRWLRSWQRSHPYTGNWISRPGPWLAMCNLEMDVSKNSGTPQIIHLIGFSIINHPFWGTPIFGNTQMPWFFVVNFAKHIWGRVGYKVIYKFRSSVLEIWLCWCVWGQFLVTFSHIFLAKELYTWELNVYLRKVIWNNLEGDFVRRNVYLE